MDCTFALCNGGCKLTIYGELTSIVKAKSYVLSHIKTSIIYQVNHSLVNKNEQATKSKGWMPWHRKPMKDAVSCEKLR